VRSLLASLLRTETDWERLRIQQGFRSGALELGEDTRPRKPDWERTHIDYHKGCYIGQEVISRLKSVGHVNRSLVAFSASSAGGVVPEPGSERFAPDSPTEGVLGKITSAVGEAGGN